MIFMASTTSVITSLAAIAAIGGVAYLAYKHFQKGVKADEQTPTLINPAVSRDSVNLSGIVKHLKGNMNPLTSVVNDFDKDSASVLFENLYQIVDGHGDDEMRKWMNTFFANRNSWTENDCKTKAEILLKLMNKCGISPVQENVVVWSEGLKDKYNKLMPLEEGQSCNVVAPYWMYEGTIYEKGIVIKL